MSLEIKLAEKIENAGLKIKHIGYKNNVATLILITPIEFSAKEFLDSLHEDSFETVYKFVNKVWRRGRKIENRSFINITFIVKGGIYPIDENYQTGKVISFIKNNNFKDFDDFIKRITYAVKDLNIYNKISGDKVNKKKYYSLKRQWISFLYENKMIEDFYVQENESEELMLFKTKIDNINFHIQMSKFYDMYNIGGTIKRSGEFYSSKQNPKTEADYTDIEFAKSCEVILTRIMGHKFHIYNLFNKEI